MVYRKTEAVLAHQEAKRVAILAATLDIIGRHGMAAVTVDLVAARVGGSVGMLYKYFANRDEMIAGAVNLLLAADLAAMREATGDAEGVEALARGVAAYYGRLKKPRLVRAMLDRPYYREGVRDELAKLVRGASDLSAPQPHVAADAMLGALCGIYQAGGRPTPASIAASFALRCVGLSAIAASKAIERYSLT